MVSNGKCELGYQQWVLFSGSKVLGWCSGEGSLGTASCAGTFAGCFWAGNGVAKDREAGWSNTMGTAKFSEVSPQRSRDVLAKGAGAAARVQMGLLEVEWTKETGRRIGKG